MSINNERSRHVIIHKDGDWQNNDAMNLEWLTAPILVSRGNCFDDGVRTEESIWDYEREAMDKAWFARTRPDNDSKVESVRRKNVERIIATYPDIPDGGYNNWQSGYWNGILSALRWVLGEEKDFIDT